MTSLCTAAVFVNHGRSGMFVGQFLGAGKREARKKEKQEKKKRELKHRGVTAGNGLMGVDCAPCVDSMSPQSLGLGEEPGN